MDQNSDQILCECGCGNFRPRLDKYKRKMRFISGHRKKKYADKREHKRQWEKRNRLAKKKYAKNRANKKKILLIKAKGGKCSKCNVCYNGENGIIFTFHHRNPVEKYKEITKLIRWESWEKTLIEAEKCDLFCRNCHWVEHRGEF